MPVAIPAIFGFNNASTEGAFARWHAIQSQVNYKHGVVSGLNVTATGTRQVRISPSDGLIIGGVAAEVLTAVTLPALDAYTGTGYRTDTVVARARWGEDVTELDVVKGQTSALPDLTQTLGSVWEMPVAHVRVRQATTGLIPASDIIAAKPLPRFEQNHRVDLVGTVDLNANTGALFDIITTTLPDPGWPYFLSSLSNADVRGDSGYIRVILTANGTQWADSRSIMVSEGARDGVAVIGTSPVMSGAVTVKMRAAIDSGVAGMGGSVRDNTNLRLIQHPAA